MSQQQRQQQYSVISILHHIHLQPAISLPLESRISPESHIVVFWFFPIHVKRATLTRTMTLPKQT